MSWYQILKSGVMIDRGRAIVTGLALRTRRRRTTSTFGLAGWTCTFVSTVKNREAKLKYVFLRKEGLEKLFVLDGNENGRKQSSYGGQLVGETAGLTTKHLRVRPRRISALLPDFSMFWTPLFYCAVESGGKAIFSTNFNLRAVTDIAFLYSMMYL